MPTMEIGERPFSSLPQCLLSAYTHIFHLYHHLPPSPSPLPFPRVSDLVFSHFLSMHSYIPSPPPSPIPAPSLLKAPKVKIPPTKPPHNIHSYIPSLPSSPPFSFSPPFTWVSDLVFSHPPSIHSYIPSLPPSPIPASSLLIAAKSEQPTFPTCPQSA